MITVTRGDLLKATEDAIGHGCNTHATMGAGVAASISSKWPEVYQADVKHPVDKGANRIGTFSYALVNGKMIYNIYTQTEFSNGQKDVFQYEGFEKGLAQVMQHMKSHGLKTLALPRIGAGLAGGNWEMIKSIISSISNKYSIDVTIYEL